MFDSVNIYTCFFRLRVGLYIVKNCDLGLENTENKLPNLSFFNIILLLSVCGCLSGFVDAKERIGARPY